MMQTSDSQNVFYALHYRLNNPGSLYMKGFGLKIYQLQMKTYISREKLVKNEIIKEQNWNI